MPFKQKKNFENRTVRTEIEMRARNGWTDRRSGRPTDKKYKSQITNVIPVKQKKNFENWTVRTEIESKTGTDGQKDGRTERQPKSIKVRSPICHTFQTNRRPRTDGQTDGKTDGQKV